ncbi:MAG: hypothetical protein ACR2N2_09340 [Acidimicrobiia bacterium]
MRRLVVTALCTAAMFVGVIAPAAADVGEPEGVGLHDPTTGIWYLLKGTGEQTDFYFGDPNDFGFLGDWNCNGEDTPGLYRQSDGYVYLRETNTQGIADIQFFFGDPGDVPLAGDFNGDGCDTVSIWRPSENRVYVINKLGSNDNGLGAAEFFYTIGKPGDQPFVGDFNGNGKDSVGLHDRSTGRVSIYNNQASGPPSSSFDYGQPGSDTIIASDWNGNGTDTVGLYRAPSQYHSGGAFFLSNSNTSPVADQVVPLGVAGMRPVAGVFQDLGPGIPPPIPPPNYPTVAQVKSGEAYGDVIMRGAVVARTNDSDEFWFSDGTGRIVIDLNTTRVDPNSVVLNVCYFIEGRAGRNEIDVSGMVRCS